MNVVRTYKFDRRSSSKTILFRASFSPTELDEFDSDGVLHIAYELGAPVSSALCPSRIRVHASSNLGDDIVISEVTRFFQTLKQMYSL